MQVHLKNSHFENNSVHFENDSVHKLGVIKFNNSILKTGIFTQYAVYISILLFFYNI